MNEPIQYIPFFNIYSKALHEALGVEDMRSVKSRLKNIGVKIYGSEKDSYIICEEVVPALRNGDKMQESSYEAKGNTQSKILVQGLALKE